MIMAVIATTVFTVVGKAHNGSACSSIEKEVVFQLAQDDAADQAAIKCVKQGGANFLGGECVGTEENLHVNRAGQSCYSVSFVCTGKFSCLKN